jgi:hypothetical protein
LTVSGRIPREEFLELLGGTSQVWFRLAALSSDQGWTVGALEMTSNVAPTDWARLEWTYPGALFVSDEVRGSAVADWFRAGALVPPGADYTVMLPPWQDAVQERRASGQASAYAAGEWPSVDYDLGQNHPANPQHTGLLISGSAPSFQSYAKALARFFRLATDMNVQPHRALYFREPDVRARIDSVHVTTTAISVTVTGSSLAGNVVELASDVEGPSQQLEGSSPQTVTFELHASLPPNSWIVLKSGDEWLDRKFLQSTYGTADDAGVTYEADPVAEIEALIAQGETTMIEFKSRLPGDGDRDYRKALASTVAAFANQHGGWLVIGVSNDGQIQGIGTDRTLDQATVQISSLVRTMVTPLPEFDVTTHEVHGHHVVLVTVEPGSIPPYGIEPAKPRFFIRRGATTFVASADTVRTLARSRPALEQNPRFPGNR